MKTFSGIRRGAVVLFATGSLLLAVPSVALAGCPGHGICDPLQAQLPIC